MTKQQNLQQLQHVFGSRRLPIADMPNVALVTVDLSTALCCYWQLLQCEPACCPALLQVLLTVLLAPLD